MQQKGHRSDSSPGLLQLGRSLCTRGANLPTEPLWCPIQCCFINRGPGDPTALHVLGASLLQHS